MRWYAPVVAAAVAVAGCGRLDFHDVPADAARDAAIQDAPIVDAIDATVIDPCAASYTTMHGLSRYRFGTPTTWDSAEHACEADGRGSHLAVFNNSQEMNLIEDDVDPTVFWVGVTDRVTDGTFIDVLGDNPLPFLPGWKAGDPSFNGPGCVQHDPNARVFHDQDCSTLVAYVCECDGVVAQPSSY